MSYKLEKPYSNKDYADFVVEHNYNNSRTIEITETCAYALEPNEIIKDGKPIINPNYEEEQAAKKRKYYNGLSLTGADVERAIYQIKGIDFDDLIELVQKSESTDIDIKALKIELKANNFYRGNPYIEKVGQLLGFTSEKLDKFFETKDAEQLK